MSLLRTDVQMALNDLHVALMESADYYRYAADFLAGPVHQDLCQELQRFSEERSAVAGQVEATIRQTGDLPSVPDDDRETGTEWLQRLGAVLDENQATHVLSQRLEAEEYLLQMLTDYTMAPVQQSHYSLYQQVQQHLQATCEQLRDLRSKGV